MDKWNVGDSVKWLGEDGAWLVKARTYKITKIFEDGTDSPLVNFEGVPLPFFLTKQFEKV